MLGANLRLNGALRRPGPLPAAPSRAQGFPQWRSIMDGWGESMLDAVRLVATAAAVGFGLPGDAITSLMERGPHLLAPTGSDLSRHGTPGTVLAGGQGGRGPGAPGRAARCGRGCCFG